VSRVELPRRRQSREQRYRCAVQFSVTGLATGSHTAQATAFDNATPPLSTATALIPFTVLAAQGASITVSPATLNIAGGANATSNLRLSPRLRPTWWSR
jgi:hypothetical protein